MSKASRNRRNAQSSTGPRTPEGKAASSMNALKTGLTGRTVLLPTDDAAAFEQHVASYFAEYQPEGLRERELAQSIAETRWRLNRSFVIEAAIFAQVSPAAEEGAPLPAALDNLLRFEKTLKNLHLQESRLSRRFDKDLAEIRELQQTRTRNMLAAMEAMINGPSAGALVASNFNSFDEYIASERKTISDSVRASQSTSSAAPETSEPSEQKAA